MKKYKKDIIISIVTIVIAIIGILTVNSLKQENKLLKQDIIDLTLKIDTAKEHSRQGYFDAMTIRYRVDDESDVFKYQSGRYKAYSSVYRLLK